MSEEDEFDDLFSFSVGSPTNATAANETNNDNGNHPTAAGITDAVPLAPPSSAAGGGAVSSSNQNPDTSTNASNKSNGSTSTSISESESYCKVSSPSENQPKSNEEDDDDIFGEFDLDNIQLRSTTIQHSKGNDTKNLKEEDFNGMDEGTREFLDFLDGDQDAAGGPSSGAGVGVSSARTVTGGNTTTSEDVMKDILGDDTVKVQVLNDAGDILAGLEDDSSDEEEDEKVDKEKQPPQENDLEDVAGFVTVESNDTQNSANSIMSVDINEAPNSSTSEDKTKNNSPIELNMKSKITRSISSSSNKSYNSTLSNATPTIVKLPTLPKKNRQTSSSSARSLLSNNSSQRNSILESVDVDFSDSLNTLDLNTSNEGDVEGGKEEKVEEVKEITFESLSEALRSTESKLEHIRSFMYNKRNKNHTSSSNSSSTSSLSFTSISKEDRPYLWSKVICSKVLKDVQFSSLVDSFMTFHTDFDYRKFESKEIDYDLEDDTLIQKILNDVEVLSIRVVHGISGGSSDGLNISNEGFQVDESVDYSVNEGVLVKAKRDLCSLLVFYYRSTNVLKKNINTFASILDVKDPKEIKNGAEADTEARDEAGLEQPGVEEEQDEGEKKETEKKENVDSNALNAETDLKESGKGATDTDTAEEESKASAPNSTTEPRVIEWKSLLGPIAATLLSAGIPIEVASVMLSRIISTLPLVSLDKFERQTAVKLLHQQLYFLVCYHLPLLVLHLDRYAPGWHWPRVIDTEEQEDGGAGDSPTEKSRNLEAHGTIPITWFVSLLAGEGTSDTLDQTKLLSLWDILLTCDDQSLKFFLALAILEKQSDSLMMLRGQSLIDELSAVMSFKPTSKIDDGSFLGSETSDDLSNDDVLRWYHEAKTLQESTPSSVTSNLQQTEDVAVNHILTMRSKIALEKMKARLEEEAEAHQKAVEEENTRKAEARLHQYYKKRLGNFYDKHCPDKKASVDKIMEVYKDEFPVLDEKLKVKYGAGFLPMIHILNPRISNQTNKFISNVGKGIEKRKKNLVASRAKERAEKLNRDLMGPGEHQVAIKISANEILPFVCGLKSKSNASHEPLKYYLVDSRPSETVKVQGAFPTSVHLSPEDLMDPDRIQEKVDMFESLRGAVHICIMGEGFSSFPELYDNPLSQVQEKLLENDESRTNMCALFFVKKGFPFISVLNGGFAAAHSWLSRDCDYLTPTKVLVDYDEQTSLFADLERSYQAQKEYSNASSRRKTTLALQKLLDNSMTRITMLENRIEEFAERPRLNAKKEQKEPEKSIDRSDGQNTNRIKIQTMKQLFKKPMNKATQSEQEGTNDKASESSSNLSPDSKETKDKEAPNNAVKSGFNKAFNGLKNIRVPRPSKDKDSNTSKDSKKNTGTEEKPSLVKKDDNDESPHMSFNFNKIKFSRKTNAFARKPKQTDEDDDLEKEILASLTKPQEVKQPKKPKEKAASGPAKPRNNPFKNRFKKMNLNKFGSIAQNRPIIKPSQTIIREEESLFFEEESLDGTEDLVSNQTDEMYDSTEQL